MNSSISSSERRHARYLAVLAAAAGAASLALAGFNWLIDPYGVFGAPVIDGVNRVKHGIATHLRLAKAHAVRTAGARTVILGSSRAESSYDPRHEAFRHRPVYNLALSGAGVYELYRYLQHAHAAHPLAEAVLALDFYMFNADWPVPRDFDEGRLLVAADGKPNPARFGATLALLLSWDAFGDSRESLRRQQEAGASYREDGLRDESHDIPAILAGGGHRRAFIASEEYFLGYTYSPRGRGYAFTNGRPQSDAFAWLQRILEHCRRHGIALTTIINPVHARQHETIAAAGLASLYEEWRRRLVRIYEEDARAHPGAPRFELWDFGLLNTITTEPVPDAGDASTRMRWYRESSHFTRALGDLVLRSVLTGRVALDETGTPIGVRLDPRVIDEVLARERSALERWRAEHPADVAEIAAAAARLRARRER